MEDFQAYLKTYSVETNEILEIYKQSFAVLDIELNIQNGLTMRTFEALGSGKKIITTNTEIKKYPFYNENNVFVIDRENIVLQKTFFDSPFIQLDSVLYENMSITGWLKAIFFETKPNYWIEGLK